jgi:TM2 domain-containing membrane protein YozV
MNCPNHPDAAAVAYCQNCGKPLCSTCMRSVGGVVYCESCLAARLSSQAATGQPAQYGMHAHPVLAGLLGFIPGVGAMYNGQFVKALAHVLIFAVFVSLADKSVVFGLLVAAWVFYQVFDAAQTAKARRDGLPLPNPFGLNDLGARLGMTPASPFVAGFGPPPGSTAPGGPAAANPNPDFGQSAGPYTGQTPPPGYTPPPSYPASYVVPPEAPGQPIGSGGPYASGLLPSRKHPFGAVVLIVIGLLLLLHTLGVFEDEWIGRAWPLVLIGIGVWLLYSRTRDLPRGGPQ